MHHTFTIPYPSISELHICIWWEMFSRLILNRWYWRLNFYMHPIKLDVGFEINGLWVLELGHWTSWFLDSVWYWFLNGEIGFQNFGFWGRLNWNSCPKLRFKITCFKRDPSLELVGALASNLQVQTLKKNDTTSQAHPLSTCTSTRFSPFCKAKLLLWQIQPGLILWVDSHHLSDRFKASVSACFWNFSTGFSTGYLARWNHCRSASLSDTRWEASENLSDSKFRLTQSISKNTSSCLHLHVITLFP